MDFGNNLKCLIKASGKTQTRVAKELNVPITTINSWIRNANYPRFLQIKPLCRILDIEIEELFDYEE